ncbi:hypothetical protein NQ317_017828 [Molorchus minor]|uniref:Sulfatase N-terminal domain-containing protein n=1 Tax=Molorchus minor TaxID=1323400 RepID=A0ABQ9K0N9_9CUCU|nr:hypothetical protein NQ317_017828 [Molorchus minor]
MFLYLQMFLTLWVFMFVETKPNFILILTDDQDLLLNGLVPMNRTLKLIANYGKVFENAFVNSPICCPSRSTILTGKYAHNTGVVNNSIDGNCSSTFWQKRHEPFSMASVLKDNGYVTFYAGKYLNQKHWIVSMPPQELPGNVSILDDIQRRRLQTLLAVDELVEKLINKLKESPGFIQCWGFKRNVLGQFTQPWDKRQPYETDIRVPMLVRGPGIPRKTLESYPVSSVDLAPTILELADVEVPGDMDGKSFKNVLTSKERVQFIRHIFVEYWGEGNARSIDGRCPWKYDRNLAECSCDQWCKCQDSKNNTYTCVIDISNKQTFKFCRFEDDQGFIEAYNITEDPYELSNCYLKMDKAVVESYLKRLERFEKCSGKKCDIFYA